MIRMTMLVALAAACANPQKKCAESVHLRAAGQYQGESHETAEKYYFEYLEACTDACDHELDRSETAEIAEATDVCTESDLLVADDDPASGLAAVEESCKGGKGDARSCAWLDSHADLVRSIHADEARKAAVAATPTPTPPPKPEETHDAADWYAIDFTNEMVKAGSAKRFDLDETFPDRSITFTVHLEAGHYYGIMLVGNGGMPFTAVYGPTQTPFELVKSRNSYEAYVMTLDGITVDTTQDVPITITADDALPTHVRVVGFSD